MAEKDPARREDVEVAERPRVETPRRFRVVLFNDDYTTQEFVLHLLETVFLHGPSEAMRIMMKVHLEGRGIAGTYTREVAETKVATVHAMARREGFPLRAAAEAE